jgi:metal-sulfur cluster biosynthetic enzyme
MVTIDQIRDALEDVNDPHVPVSLRKMGMLRDITTTDGVVYVQLCIPCLGCPGISMLRDRIEEAILPLEGVRKVEIENGFFLPWSRDMVDNETKTLMRTNGIQI